MEREKDGMAISHGPAARGSQCWLEGARSGRMGMRTGVLEVDLEVPRGDDGMHHAAPAALLEDVLERRSCESLDIHVV